MKAFDSDMDAMLSARVRRLQITHRLLWSVLVTCILAVSLGIQLRNSERIAQRLEIVGPAGTSRFIIDASEEHVIITMLDVNRNVRAKLTGGDSVSELIISSGVNGSDTQVFCNPIVRAVGIPTALGARELLFGVDPAGPLLSLYDRSGKGQLDLRIEDPVPNIEIRDKHSKLLARMPPDKTLTTTKPNSDGENTK